MNFHMNPQRGRHLDGGAQNQGQGPKHPQSIHIHHAGDGPPHPHNPHHVHVHHADGTHEHTEHGSFQEAMDHVHEHHGMDDGEQRPEQGGDEGIAGAVE